MLIRGFEKNAPEMHFSSNLSIELTITIVKGSRIMSWVCTLQSVLRNVREHVRDAMPSPREDSAEYAPPLVIDSYATADAINIPDQQADQIDAYAASDMIPEIQFEPADRVTPAFRKPSYSSLQRRLESYVKKQNVIAMDNVYGVYVAEYLQEKAEALPIYSPEDVRNMAKVVDGIDGYTSMDMDYALLAFINRLHGSSLQKDSTQTVVILPAKIVRFIDGDRVARNSFDSIFYHEVAGHAADATPSSAVFAFCLRASRRVVEEGGAELLPAYREIAKMWGSPLSEAHSYLLELDRLVMKMGFLENAGVVNAGVRHRIENILPKFVLYLLNKVADKREAQEGFKEVAVWYMKQVSPKTRRYLSALMRRKLRDRDFMREEYKMGARVDESDLHLLGL